MSSFSDFKKGYMIVRSGGQYSDAYHSNDVFFLEEEEAKEYINKKMKENKIWNSFVEESPTYDFNYAKAVKAANKIFKTNKGKNTQSVNLKVAAYVKQEEEKYNEEFRVKTICLVTSKYPEILDRVSSKPIFYFYKEECDYDYEEVEIPVSSKLYKILTNLNKKDEEK